MHFWDNIRNYFHKRLFRAVDISNVVRSSKGKVYIGDSEITLEELKSLQEEAKLISKLRLWRLMTETVRHQAMETGFKTSTVFDDVKTCKMMLVNLDIIESMLTIFKNRKLE